MPDLVQIADQLKTVPDQFLASELQNPSGIVPSYLVLGELQRRQLLRAGGGTQKAPTSVLQDTLQQLAPPRPVGPPPPPGMTPPSMMMPRTGLATMPGSIPPQNMAMMPMRPMQEGGLVSDMPSDYLSELSLRQQYAGSDLLPGMYQEGGEVDEDDEEESPSTGYAARSVATYDPTPAEESTLNEIARRESGGNPFLRNRHSTASGKYQFIDPTWKETAAKTGVGTDYPSAYLAPTRDQQINALHLLREDGPNSSHSWAASGPYPNPYDPSFAQLIGQAQGLPQQPAASAAPLVPNSPVPPDQAMPAAAAAPAAPAATPAAPATWAPPADGIKAPNLPELKALTEEQAARTRYQDQLKNANTYDANRQAIAAQFGPFDDPRSRQGIQWLMDQAQENLHPSISNVLLRMGAALLAAPPTGFGQAFGRASLETMQALDQQKQQGRQDWVDALKLGIQLDDKQREYNYQIAQLAQAKTSTEQSRLQTLLTHTDSQINTLQEKLGANKQYQQYQRGLEWNNLNPDRQLTGPFDPNLSRLSDTDQRLYLGQNLPAPRAAKTVTPASQIFDAAVKGAGNLIGQKNITDYASLPEQYQLTSPLTLSEPMYNQDGTVTKAGTTLPVGTVVYPQFQAAQAAKVAEETPDQRQQRLQKIQEAQDIEDAKKAPFDQSLISYTKTGIPYVDLTNYTGKDRSALIEKAHKYGVDTLSKQEADAQRSIDIARGYLQRIHDAIYSRLPKDPSGRLLSIPSNVILGKFFQGDPALAAAGTWVDAAIQNTRAAAGSGGLRIQKDLIDKAYANLPQLTDSLDTAMQKIKYMGGFYRTAELNALPPRVGLMRPDPGGSGKLIRVKKLYPNGGFDPEPVEGQ